METTVSYYLCLTICLTPTKVSHTNPVLRRYRTFRMPVQKIIVFFQKAIFQNSWVVAGRSDLVLSPGNYFADYLYEEPLLVTFSISGPSISIYAIVSWLVNNNRDL